MNWHATLPAVTLSGAFLVTGCVLFQSKETRYLESAKNHATEADVKHYLGEPAGITSDEHGPNVWVYERRQYIQQGTNNAWTTLDAWRCDTYRLMFDDTHILRNWVHASHEC
jgi:hypothetical protein